MAPEKKTITTIGSSGAERPVSVRAGDGVIRDGSRGAAREHSRRSSSRSRASGVVRAQDDEPRATKSKDGAGPLTGGAGPSKGGVVPHTGGAATSKTPTPAPTACSSQAVRDERCHHGDDPGRRRGKSPVYRSRDAKG